MRPTPRLYLLIVFAPLAAIAFGCVLLNMWIDPQDTLRYQQLSTRTYALPALLTELERPTTSESDIDVFLLGTSRTQMGHPSLASKALNLGISDANDGLIENLLTGLLQTSTRSHVYFVDAMGGRRGKSEGKVLLRYLVNSRITSRSLYHIVNETPSPSVLAAGSHPDNIASEESAEEHLRRNLAKVEYLRNSLLARPNTRAAIKQRIQRISKLSVPHDALVVYYDGPHSPQVMNDPLIVDALQQRAHIWAQVVAELNAAQLSAEDVFSSSAERPRVTVVYASYATPIEWGEPAAPEVWSEANWLDAWHFNSTIGKALLDRLMSVATSESN